jgi:hypothetical protein
MELENSLLAKKGSLPAALSIPEVLPEVQRVTCTRTRGEGNTNPKSGV